MKLNLQNKIHGTRFATVLLYSHGKGQDSTVSSGEVHYSINNESIKEIGIPSDFEEDFANQLKDLGGHEKIAEIFKIEPYSGMYNSPLVLRHREIPQIIAQVSIQDRGGAGESCDAAYSPNHRYYDAQFILNCYLDPSAKEDYKYNEEEEYLKTFDALSSRRLDITEEELEELLKD